MKSIIDNFRLSRARRAQGMPSSAHDLFTVVVQGLTVLRIAVLVLVLYVKFKLEHIFDRRRD